LITDANVKVFIDTWGWITLLDRRQPRHREVEKFFHAFRRRAGTFFTSDYILDETITAVFSHHSFNKADAMLALVEQAVIAGSLRLERINEDRFNQAVKLRRKFADKPRISFTDLTSMVVMSELAITDVWTEDNHFLQVGRGFNKVP
jgi:uncharacterized protein